MYAAKTGEVLTPWGCEYVAERAMKKLRLVMSDIGCEAPEDFT